MAQYAVGIFFEGFVPLFCTSLSVSALGVGTKELSRRLNKRNFDSNIPPAPVISGLGPAPITCTRNSRQTQRDKAILLLREPEVNSISFAVDQSDQRDSGEPFFNDDGDDHEAARQGRRAGAVSRAGFHSDEEKGYFRALSPDTTQIPLPEDDPDSDSSTADHQGCEPRNEYTSGQKLETKVILTPGSEPRQGGQLIDPMSEEGERMLSDIKHFLHLPRDMEPLEVIVNLAYDRETIFRNLRYARPYMLQYSEGAIHRYTNVAISSQHDARYRDFVENLYAMDWNKIFEADSGDFLVKLLEQRHRDIEKLAEFFRFMDERRKLKGDERFYQDLEMGWIRRPPRRGGLGATGIQSPMRYVVTPDDVQEEQSPVEEQNHLEE